MRANESSDCCTPTNKSVPNADIESISNPDHSLHVKRLNRIIGQLVGVKRMVEERRYCPDILTQTRAAASALKAVELLILETHLRHCVAEAINAPDSSRAAKKIEELVDVVGRF